MYISIILRTKKRVGCITVSNCANCIWEEFSAPLKGFIIKRVANEQDVADILQDIFVKIYNNIGSLTDDNKIDAWIYTIARNTINDYYRRKCTSYELLELSEDIKDNSYEEKSENAEIALCLKAIISNLPEKYKEAILLTEFQNMTQKELSEKQNISLSGAKSRVQRARKMLKKMLLDCCNLEFDRRGNIIDYKHKNGGNKYC